ncbi:hypothetical protein E0H86_07195 [Acinetobacter sp. ANC 4635]|uniref:phage scaffolding protein n=1 Tax=Acinetobacter sp. ANC 4635 TaxID=2529846 RepID=UPI00103CC2DA|nr:phage scaffolding protein [Acinetobacter sp. ANC 4635]TCB32194.1 hypothetical protein E0H86_07195 [Acinetobacter sp. ANC 4635]
MNKLQQFLFRNFHFDEANPDGGAGGGGTPQSGVFSAEYVRELRAENKGLRLNNQALTAKVEGFETEKAEAVAKAVEDAKVQAKEEAKAQAKEEARTEVQAEADQRVLLAKLESEAVKNGMVDVDGLKLADLSGVSLKDGKLEGADALFAGLKESKPYLFGQPQSNSSTTQNPPPANPPTPKNAREMTDEEYAAAKASVTKLK